MIGEKFRNITELYYEDGTVWNFIRILLFVLDTLSTLFFCRLGRTIIPFVHTGLGFNPKTGLGFGLSNGIH